MIPVVTLITGFLVFKSVQLGLRWQIETKQEAKPTLNNPVKEHIQEKKIEKEQQEIKNNINAWIYGDEGR